MKILDICSWRNQAWKIATVHPTQQRESPTENELLQSNEEIMGKVVWGWVSIGVRVREVLMVLVRV